MIQDRNKPKAIKDECMKVFCNENLLHTKESAFIEQSRKIYSLPNVQKVLKNTDLITTAQYFFDNNLNISRASKDGFMHRNTLVYRVQKITKLIGLDIRQFNQAVVFHNLILFHSLFEE